MRREDEEGGCGGRRMEGRRSSGSKEKAEPSPGMRKTFDKPRRLDAPGRIWIVKDNGVALGNASL